VTYLDETPVDRIWEMAIQEQAPDIVDLYKEQPDYNPHIAWALRIISANDRVQSDPNVHSQEKEETKTRLELARRDNVDIFERAQVVREKLAQMAFLATIKEATDAAASGDKIRLAEAERRLQDTNPIDTQAIRQRITEDQAFNE
jgi:hypothetical protein